MKARFLLTCLAAVFTLLVAAPAEAGTTRTPAERADIGAGGGWFTLHLARRVGPNGIVYAEDIQRAMIEAIGQRVQSENLLGRGEPVKNSVDNDRAGLQTAFFAGVEAPSDGELLDVFTINLRKAGIVIVLGRSTVDGPVLLASRSGFLNGGRLPSNGCNRQDDQYESKESRANNSFSQLCTSTKAKRG